MSKEQASQPQQPAAFPFAAPSFEDALNRLRAFNEQAVAMQQRAAEQARAAIDESARVMKETVAYGQRLSDDWRKLATETFEKLSSFTGKQG